MCDRCSDALGLRKNLSFLARRKKPFVIARNTTKHKLDIPPIGFSFPMHCLKRIRHHCCYEVYILKLLRRKKFLVQATCPVNALFAPDSASQGTAISNKRNPLVGAAILLCSAWCSTGPPASSHRMPHSTRVGLFLPYVPQKIGNTFYKCMLIPQSSCSSSL